MLVIVTIFFFINTPAKDNIVEHRDGISIVIDSVNIQLHILGKKIVRIECRNIRETQRHQSLMVVNPTPENVKWSMEKTSEAVILATSNLNVNVDLSSGKIQFLDVAGNIILQEGNREIKQVNVIGENTNSIRQKYLLSESEAIYGLGQHQQGNMNLRGKTVELYQENMKVSVPMLVSSKSYGILWDNYSLSKFTDNINGMELWSEVADGIDYYFIAGKNLDEVISEYRKITGQAPLFPKWAYGLFQSKERYQSQAELLGVVNEYRQRQVPLDVIVQDWRYWDPQKWGSHNMDRDRFPDPLGMVDELHKKNTKVIISIWGKFEPVSPNYDELNDNGFLWKATSWEKSRYYNAYHPEARAIYWRQIKDSLFTKGFDGWWLDATEPETGDMRNDNTKKLMNNNLGTGARYLNAYPLMTTKAVYEGQRQVTSDKRVYILTRSAYPGQQRYGATTWSGDITATWDVFHKQISAGLNFCITGIPYWTTDIGGYTVLVQNGYKNDMYKELFTRWYQYGVFCPIFRVHGSSTPREIWRFGEKGSWSYDTQLKYDNLRYRLMPYIYSLAWKVTHDNYTIMRGLVFDFAKDTNVYNIDDQFMFGPSILVNPVTETMYYPWKTEDPGKIIPPDYLIDINGKPGLTGEYFQGMNFEKLIATRTDQNIDFNWGEDAPVSGMQADSFSVRWRGQLIAPETGEYSINTLSDDGARLFINNKIFTDRWQDQAPLIESAKIFLEKGKKYDIKLEFYEKWMGATVQLNWILPSEHKVEDLKLPDKSRKVYLPYGKQWFDFWTGKTYDGGQTITAPAPIEIMPLYIKAGSIIPMGPFLQYATEKPADPVELRVYTGSDGSFTLYEDENDNYNYEKGVYSTIPIQWNDSKKTLTIGNRKGSFSRMLLKREFHIVWVNPGHGVGLEREEKPDKIVSYNGNTVIINPY